MKMYTYCFALICAVCMNEVHSDDKAANLKKMPGLPQFAHILENVTACFPKDELEHRKYLNTVNNALKMRVTFNWVGSEEYEVTIPYGCVKWKAIVGSNGKIKSQMRPISYFNRNQAEWLSDMEEHIRLSYEFRGRENDWEALIISYRYALPENYKQPSYNFRNWRYWGTSRPENWWNK